jgi:hypothetical protein
MYAKWKFSNGPLYLGKTKNGQHVFFADTKFRDSSQCYFFQSSHVASKVAISHKGI